MLKFQVVLIAVLIGCIGFVACERTQTVLEPVMMDPEITEMTGMDAHKSWEHKMLDGPWLDFKGDVAHDLGSRTIYFNEAAAMANKAGTAYPVGAMIIKESMDATNTFVSQVSTMMKTDGMMNNGWVYGVSGMPVSAAGDLTMPNQLTAEMGAGCHGCHANATNDFVFVPLSMDDGMTDDGMTDDGMADDGMQTMAWQTMAWQTMAWQTMAWQTMAWQTMAWQTMAWQTMAWQTMAWQTMAWQTMAWQTMA